MKKTLCLFLSIIMAVSIFTAMPLTTSAASSGKCGENANWSYSNGTLKITGSGNTKDYFWESNVPWYDNLESIKTVTISEGITGIGTNTFSNCSNLTSVTLPDSLINIGMGAFSGCTSLKSITLPEKLNVIEQSAFEYCKSLTSITIPKSVKTIEYYAFNNCTKLKTIKILGTLETLCCNVFENTAFYNTASNWSENVLYIGDNLITAFKFNFETNKYSGFASGDYTVKPGTKTIAEQAFCGCENLTSVNLPSSLKYIGDNIFMGCTGLRKITVNSDSKYFSSSNGVLFSKNKDTLIKYPESKTTTSYTVPSTVKIISDSAFENAKKLVSVTVSDGVETIGYCGFVGCTKLKTIKLPDTIYNIEFGAFYNTAYFNDSENWSKNVLYIGNHLIETKYTFSSKSYTVKDGTKSIADEAFSGIESLESITLPKTLTGIGYAAFQYTDITSIKLPSNLKYIGAYAFSYTGLKSVTLPSKINKIENGTFAYCTNLTSVKIPDSVTYIGAQAFDSCQKLKTVTIPYSVKEIGEKALGYGQFTLEDQEQGIFSKVEGFTIKGGDDTSAEKYAKANGFTFKTIAKPGKAKLTAISNTTSGVKITWSKVNGAESYVVYRKTASGSYKAIKTVTGTSYTDTKAKSGTKYTYRVKAKNAAGLGAYSENYLSIVRLRTPTLRSVTSGKSGITIKWATVTGADGYYVYRKTGSGDWSKIATVKGNSKVSYLNKSTKKGTTYTYTVRAYDGKYVSARNSTGLKIKDKY